MHLLMNIAIVLVVFGGLPALILVADVDFALLRLV
jgi:hypothetical protein